jgi:DNA-binding XRE family transcriptional regulator
MPDSKSHFVIGVNFTERGWNSHGVKWHPSGMVQRLRSEEIGARLRIARKALGLNAAEFCRGAGIAQNAYSQYETGTRLLTLSAAVKLSGRYRLSLDWIYQDDPSGLPHALAEKINSAPTE